MRRRQRDPERTFHLAVLDGFVSCPRRGVIDIFECFVCRNGRGLSGEADEHFLCAWDPISASYEEAARPPDAGARRGA